MPAVPTTSPVCVFYSYAHEDEDLCDELQGHLKILERRGLLSAWHDRKIVAGEDWNQRIDEKLREAELVLLLVSKDFVNSDYIAGTELALAMQRHADGATTVVPILVRALNLEPEDADAFPFLKLQGLPTDLKPVTSWPNRDEAWTDVAKGLRATVKSIHARRPARPPTSGAPAPAPAPSDATVGSPRDATRGRSRGGGGGTARELERFEAAPAPADHVLERVVDGFTAILDEAHRQRSGTSLDRRLVRAEALRLIDTPGQKRVLWVDDRPQGNQHEMAALCKLQIEVRTALSTGAALDLFSGDEEGFDLVISDWDRRADGARAGLELLRRLREHRADVPLVYYHGEFDPARRARRADEARAAGALGEAVLPAELFELVLRALRA